MSRSAALAAAILALALASPGAAGAADPASGGLRRLQSYEQRTRLQDLSTGVRRRFEADRLRARGDPAALERARRRWRAEDRRLDFQRDREREAIERRVDAEERIERAAERLPGPGPARAPGSTASRAEFERKLADVERRERLERLRRDTAPLSGPGARRWPRAAP